MAILGASPGIGKGDPPHDGPPIHPGCRGFDDVEYDYHEGIIKELAAAVAEDLNRPSITSEWLWTHGLVVRVQNFPYRRRREVKSFSVRGGLSLPSMQPMLNVLKRR